MAEYSHLRKAPITEALIDIRVKVLNGFDVHKFGALHNEIAAQ